MNDSYESAAREHVKSQQSGIWAAIDALAVKDPAAIYAEDFMHACSLLGEFDFAKVIAKLRVKYKGVSIRDWKKEVIGRRPDADTTTETSTAWKRDLITNATGAPKPLLANVMAALRGAPEWRGVLAYDEMGCRTVCLKSPPFGGTAGTWSDRHDVQAAEWLQHQGIHVGSITTAEAVQTIAYESSFHPVKEYLNGLVWDEESRVDKWLITYLGVDESDYSRAIGAKWLISAIARIMQSGCQADSCLILEGEQGIHKSSALRILGGEWFTDQISELRDKDSSQDLSGKWIVEFSDLARMSTADAGVLKSFITRRVDHYRPSYGRRSADFPRQCVFSATTNQVDYLLDETGGRRFWPVYCNNIDRDALARDRDQLWAEALFLYASNRSWWIEDAQTASAAKEEQGIRTATGAWDDLVWEWVCRQHSAWPPIYEQDRALRDKRDPDSFFMSTDDILEFCLHKKIESWTDADKLRIGKILRGRGMIRYQQRIGDARYGRYRMR